MENNRWIGWYVRAFKPKWRVVAVVYAALGLPACAALLALAALGLL